jgi:hypothetical protein
VNNQTTCIPAQLEVGMNTSTGCPIAQVMTEKGCLPEGIYPCGPGTGFLSNRCYPSVAVSDERKVTDESEIETFEDDVVVSHRHTKTTVIYVDDCRPQVKVKRGGRVVKYKYPKYCR